MGDMPIIDQAKCERCGLCIAICTCGALVMVDEAVTVLRVDDCGWCTMCELVCPTGAISCPFEIVIESDSEAPPPA